jgi:hypothetical protein
VVLAEALMDWVADEADRVVHLARVEAQPPVVHLKLARARVEAQAHPVVHPELARAEAPPWGPTYRVIRR